MATGNDVHTRTPNDYIVTATACCRVRTFPNGTQVATLETGDLGVTGYWVKIRDFTYN